MGVNLASTDAAFGFLPYGPVLHASIYAIVTNYGTAVYTGAVAEAGGTAITTKIYSTIQNMQVEETGAVGSMLGAVLGLFDSNGMPVSYLAASTAGDTVVAGYALVADHEHQEYLAQEDGDGQSIQVAEIGNNIDAIGTGGNTSTGQSTMELDSSTVNTTSTLAFKLIGVHPDDTISAAGAAANYCRFIVKMNAAHRANIDGI